LATWGRKVRTAKNNAPVKRRVLALMVPATESATENNCPDPQDWDEGENVG